MDVDEGRALGVPQLAEVEVAIDHIETLRAEPAQQDVALGLHQPLALDHTLAVVVEGALAEIRLQHRRLGLLRLEEERIVAVAPQHQHDPRPGADAADADDLAGRVDVPEPLEERAPVVRQRPPVGPDAAAGRPPGSHRASPSGASSSIGTISGGSLMIRGSPSTRWVSFENALRLSFVRAFSTFFSMRSRASGSSCCGSP